MSPSELRCLSCAFDASCRLIVADAEYALALLHCMRAARSSRPDLLLAARHAEDAAHWLGGSIAAAVSAAAREVRRAKFDAALALMESTLQTLRRELEARAIAGVR